MKEYLLFVGGFILIMLIPIVMVIGIAAAGSKITCDQFASLNPTHEFRWGFWTGCTMKTPQGFWISTSNIQYVNGEIDLGREK